MCWWPASTSDESLQRRRQLEAVAAALKLNRRVDVHRPSSNSSLCPANRCILVRCPVILVHFSKPFSTSHSQLKGKITGDKGAGSSGGRSDHIGDGRNGRDKSAGSNAVLCPCCGHACTKTEIFMCTSTTLSKFNSSLI